MTRTEPLPTPTCPTCGHVHPAGIGSRMCGCKDCGLLWTDIPFEFLAPEFQARLSQLRSAGEQEQTG